MCQMGMVPWLDCPIMLKQDCPLLPQTVATRHEAPTLVMAGLATNPKQAELTLGKSELAHLMEKVAPHP